MKRKQLPYSDRAESCFDKIAYSNSLNWVILIVLSFVGGALSGYFYHRAQIIRLIELGF